MAITKATSAFLASLRESLSRHRKYLDDLQQLESEKNAASYPALRRAVMFLVEGSKAKIENTLSQSHTQDAFAALADMKQSYGSKVMGEQLIFMIEKTPDLIDEARNSIAKLERKILEAEEQLAEKSQE